MQALKFDLITYSPYKAIEGFIEDIKDAAAAAAEGGGDGDAVAAAAGLDAGMAGLSEEQVSKAKQAAMSAADALMMSDAPLLHTPGRLALAALRSGFSKVRGAVGAGRLGGKLLCRASMIKSLPPATCYLPPSQPRFPLVLCCSWASSCSAMCSG